MQLPGRSMSGSYGYRYGFNGMETMDEIYPDKNSYAADFRMLDSRIGRWWSPDPIVKPWESPYAGFANNPDDGEWKKRDANGDIVDENGIFQLPEVTVGGGSGSSGTGTTEPTAKTSQTSKVEKHLYYEARKIGYTKNDMIILSMLDGVTKNAAISNINRGIYRPIYDPGSPYGNRFAENWSRGALAQSEWVKGISKTAGYSLSGTLLAAAGGPEIAGLLEGAPTLAVAGYQTIVATAEGVMIYSYVQGGIITSKVIGYSGALYVYVGLRVFGKSFLKFHPRIFAQMDAAHRGSIFALNDLLKQFPRVVNSNTLMSSQTNPASGNFIGVGINPWTRTIFHLGPQQNP